MTTNPDPIDPALREQLVAYLDGELDARQGRRIEELLANDSKVRRALQGLDRTWQLLDELESPAVGEHFTHTTLEMAAVAAEEDAAAFRSHGPRRRRMRSILVVAAMAAAGLAGFLAVATVMPDANRQLLQDLPLLQNLEQYRQIDSIDYLRKLEREKLFAEDLEDDQEPPAAHAPSSESLTPEDREKLVRRREQLQAMSAGEQQRIRDLHEQIENDAEGEKLREVMDRYARWLAAMPPYRRAELADMKPARRTERIKQLLQEQSKGTTQRLGDKDRESLVRWMEQYATVHAAHFLESLPEKRRRQIDKMTRAMRHRLVMGMVCQRWLSGNAAVHPTITERELSDLRARLSAEARTRLDSRPPAEQAKVLAGWLRQAARQALDTRRGDGASLIPGFHEELADFFEFQLGDAERDRLLSLPSEEMQQKLREMYLLQLKPDARKPAPAKKTPAERPTVKKTDKTERTFKTEKTAKTDKSRPRETKTKP